MASSPSNKYLAPDVRSNVGLLQKDSWRPSYTLQSLLSLQPSAQSNGSCKRSRRTTPPRENQTSQGDTKRPRYVWGLATPPKTPSPPPNRPSSQVVARNWRPLQYEDVKLGTIAWLPFASRIPDSEPILRHPDFQRDQAFGHPCVIVGLPNSQNRVLCFQVTAFTAWEGGLMQKYPDATCADRSRRSQARQRRRWLLIKHRGDGALQAHDGTTTLNTVGDTIMKDQSYVNTEKAFCIDYKLLTLEGDGVQLDRQSVEAIVQHHNSYYWKRDTSSSLRDWDPSMETRRSIIPAPFQLHSRSLIQPFVVAITD